MKFKVKIMTEIEVERDMFDETETEEELILDLFLQVKENPIQFMNRTWPEPEFFVGVTKC